MRSELVVVAVESQRVKSLSHGVSEDLQVFVAFDADPEDTRRPWIREEPGAAKRQRNRLALNSSQSGSNLLEPLGLAQELQRYVISFRANPAHIRRRRTELVAKGRDALADFGVDINGHEQAHGHITRRRTR